MKYIIAILFSACFLKAAAQQYLFTDSVQINLKSGVSVTATICRNSADTIPEPVILIYSIYASSPINRAYANIAARKGYVGMVVNTRGKFLSKQEIEPFEHDAKDAYEIIDWISKQSWCNGKVGMYGASYAGFSQWASLKNIHPALKTIVPQAAVGIGIDFPMQNNIFSSYMLQWIHLVTNNKTIDPVDFANNNHWDSVYKKWYISGLPFNSLDSIEGRENTIFQRWLKHPSYDKYWKKMTPQNNEFKKINIPILTITGYYDVDQLGAMYYFKQLSKYNKNANQYLVIGPYDHEGVQSAVTPSSLLGYKTDSVSGVKIYQLIFDWFNYILKDSSKPKLLEDKINYEVMDANKWQHASSLSDINNDTLKLYLAASKILSRSIENKSVFSSLNIDFTDRTDTAGMGKDINIVDSNIDTGKNMLSFVSIPLKHDIEINGSLFGSLKISSNKKDMDFVIQLYELTTDRKYFLLNNNVFRASYAKDISKRNLLMPDKKELIPISNSYFISKLIKKGSRLVFVIGVNKNYNNEINYGTGNAVSSESLADGKIPLNLKIYSDSYIEIPVKQ